MSIHPLPPLLALFLAFAVCYAHNTHHYILKLPQVVDKQDVKKGGGTESTSSVLLYESDNSRNNMTVIPGMEHRHSMHFKQSMRIVGGYNAPSATVPYLVSIAIVFESSNQVSGCTGSVLTAKHILTTANCMRGVNGRHDPYAIFVTKGVNPGSGKRYVVKSARVHQDYSAVRVSSNLAILTLTEPLVAPFKVVALPTSSFMLAHGSKVHAVGYGLLEDEGQEWARLQEVELRTQLYRKCINRVTLFFQRSWNPNKVFCATSPGYPRTGGRGLCAGDSGGPLFRKGSSRFLQVGVASLGTPPCAGPQTTNWFVKLKSFAPDIQQHVEENVFSKWLRVFGT